MQLHIDKSGKERKAHGSYDFPVHLSHERLSSYERGAFSWHWHPEIELTLILSGSIAYQVNDESYVLHEGDGLFCNSNALHAGHMIGDGDCQYLAATFAPRLLYGFEQSALQTRFVDPLLSDPRMASRRIAPGTPWEDALLSHLRALETLSRERPATFELDVLTRLLAVWSLLYAHAAPAEPSREAGTARDVERLRRILDYIHHHYMEHITLEDIAGQINICRSECCRFFKRHMHQSLFEYLLDYRIEKSLPLLADPDVSVQLAAEQTGFANPAYFARIFKKQMGCSPTDYRRSFASAPISSQNARISPASASVRQTRQSDHSLGKS